MIKLVLSDIDDTLVKFGLPHITPKALKAVHDVQKAGVHFSVATGRMPWDLSWMFAGDTAATETCVCCNGQLVVLDGKIIMQKEIDHAGLEAIAAIVAEEPQASLVLQEEGHRVVVGDLSADDPGIVPGRGPAWKNPVRVEEVPDRPYIKANIPLASPDVLPGLRARLIEAVPQCDFVLPNPNATLMDILPHGWGKEKGADCLRQALGLSMDEVAFFGDAENDLSLMRWATNGVAVANAVPVVADAARYHIGPSADDAVADALTEIAHAAPLGQLPEFMREQDEAAGRDE